jgi:tetratricopeptide (TPR) repeat protein
MALDKALEIDPLSATAHLEMGFYHYSGFLDFEKGLREYEIANRLSPNDSDIKWRIALVLRRQGKFEESYELMKKCFDLDPKNQLMPDQLIMMTSYLGMSELFDGYFELASDLGMDLTTGLMYKVSEKYGRNGDLGQYEKIVKESNKNIHDTWFHKYIAEYYRIIGDHELALVHVDRIRDEDHNGQTSYVTKDFLKGVVYQEMNQKEKAKEFFQIALKDANQQILNERDDPRFLAFKGKVLAYLDQKEEAMNFGKKAISIVSVDNDKLQGVDYNYDLAKIYAVSGEFELAIKELRKIQTAQPKAAIIGFLTYDAEFANIQEYPGFRELINDYREEQDI